MAWTQLKNAIASIIKDNGTEDIEGDVLQDNLFSMINNLGEYGTYAGLAELDTNPGTQDGVVFYIAKNTGVYQYFDNIDVSEDESAILSWDGSSWSKDTLPFMNGYEAITADVGNGGKFIDNNGDLQTNVLYSTREYVVSPGESYRIYGSNRGDIACFAQYNGAVSSANLVEIVTVTDRQKPYDLGKSVLLDEYVTIAAGVTRIALTFVNDEQPQLILYKSVIEFQNIVNNIDENKQEVDNFINNENNENLFYQELSDTLVSYLGDKSTNALYSTREYNVVGGQKILIKGEVRGLDGVACYAFYSGEVDSSNLISLAKNEDYAYPNDGVYTSTVNDYVVVPSNAVKMTLTSETGVDPQMLAYDAGVEDIKDVRNIDTLGDSLTMGSSNFGYYQDSLQALCNINGNNCSVRNWGVGGETSSSILGRSGAFTIKFPSGFTLPFDGSEVEVANGTTGDHMLNTYNDAIFSPLLQGFEVTINPCYISGVQCALTKYVASGTGTSPNDVRYTLKRNEVGTRDMDFNANTNVLFNTGFGLGYSEITTLWMGTNGTFTDFDDLLNQHKIAVRSLPKKYLIIGLHYAQGALLTEATGAPYEQLMQAEFGNRFFNIREYMSTNMIYDAGIAPTAQDLIDMSNGTCPASLRYDGVHLLPAANAVLGEKLYDTITNLGFLR